MYVAVGTDDLLGFLLVIMGGRDNEAVGWVMVFRRWGTAAPPYSESKEKVKERSSAQAPTCWTERAAEGDFRKYLFMVRLGRERSRGTHLHVMMQHLFEGTGAKEVQEADDLRVRECRILHH